MTKRNQTDDFRLTDAQRVRLLTLTYHDVASVYSGRPGCACGCRGSYRYHPEHLAASARSRGYGIDAVEVNLTQVKKVLNILQGARRGRGRALARGRRLRVVRGHPRGAADLHGLHHGVREAVRGRGQPARCPGGTRAVPPGERARSTSAGQSAGREDSVMPSKNPVAVVERRFRGWDDPRTTASVIASALRTVTREAEAPDTCLHFAIRWREVEPSREDGRLRATCPACRATVSRSAFTN